MERLAQIGVDSLKIEGRTKSLYYVARTAQVYRRAIDDAVAGRPFNPELLHRAGRPVQPRLHRRPAGAPPGQRLPELRSPATRVTQRSQFVGEVLGTEGLAEQASAETWVQVETKNHFAVGDLIEVVHPSGNTRCACKKCATWKASPCRSPRAAPCACGFRCLRATAARCWRG